MATFVCPHCRNLLSDDGCIPGQVATCPHCGGLVTMGLAAPAASRFAVGNRPFERTAARRRPSNGLSGCVWAIIAGMAIPLLCCGGCLFIPTIMGVVAPQPNAGRAPAANAQDREVIVDVVPIAGKTIRQVDAMLGTPSIERVPDRKDSEVPIREYHVRSASVLVFFAHGHANMAMVSINPPASSDLEAFAAVGLESAKLTRNGDVWTGTCRGVVLKNLGATDKPGVGRVLMLVEFPQQRTR